ncbi:hypothetical protein C8R44DRAFT_339511 [Mycena epipterygia]|nr:hypothetical protein C8R44DRAFT_339511 [Mycena epipterygia]
MSRPLGSTASWGRSGHDSTIGSGSFRASRLRVRHSKRSLHDVSSSHDRSPSSAKPSDSQSIRGGYKRRRRSTPLAARIAPDAQTSLTLDPSLVASSFTRNGQEPGAEGAGTPSLVSSNNFINFCDTIPGAAITNGQQLTGGSCNPAPMGQIPSVANMPSVRIFSPQNGLTLGANTTIPVSLAVGNLDAGVFVNPSANYLSAPQQLNSTGNILGHYHIVIEELDALNSTVPTDSQNFVFFNIFTFAPTDGFIEASITSGLPEGFYRITVSTHAANYQPVLAPISQHGSMNDVTYVTVTADGTAGSAPAVRRRAPIPQTEHFHQRNPSETRRVVPRADESAQSSLTLLPSVIASGFASNGQQSIQLAGASITVPNVKQ